MILSTDADYKAAKAIKRGEVAPKEPFRSLITAISGTFGVAALNASYETNANWQGRSRLAIVLDRERDAALFFKGGTYDPDKQARVAAMFESAQEGRIFRHYDTRDLFVIFESFETVARIESVGQIKEKQIETWKARLSDPDIWQIRTFFASVTVFYRTESQAKAAKESGGVKALSADFAKLVRPYDEFGYLAEAPAAVYIDSKENFDTNYQSSWLYYYR